MAITANTIYTTTRIKGNSSSGTNTSTTYYGLRYLCEEPVVNTTTGTIQHTMYFQPYLENTYSGNRYDTTTTTSSSAASYFSVDSSTHKFWIKYDLSGNSGKEYLTNSSSNSEFWLQNTSNDSNNIVDVSSIFDQEGARGFKYTFTTNISAISTNQTSVSKSIIYKIVLPTGGSSGFNGTPETTIALDLPLPNFLSAPADLSITTTDYTYNSIGVFKSDVSTSSIKLTWTAPSANGTNTVANYILRYAISSTNTEPSTLSSSVSLDITTNSININNTAFKSVLNSISEGQYLFVAIQVVGSVVTKDDYSNIIVLRKNIKPSAPTVTGKAYYDSNRNITFTIVAQKGKINTSACTFNYGSITGKTDGAYTAQLATGSNSYSFYAVDGVGDISVATTITYNPQSVLDLKLEPGMELVVGSYAAIIEDFKYTINYGISPYTVSLKIKDTQVASFTTNAYTGTYTFSSPLNALNYGASRGSTYDIIMTVSDYTGASYTKTVTYSIPKLSFTISAKGESGNTNFYKKITYTYTVVSGSDTSGGYSVVYNGNTLNLSSNGTFNISGVSYGTSVNFVFRIRDQLGLYVTRTVTLTRISESTAPAVPKNFTMDITSLYTLKPLSKKLLNNNSVKDDSIVATWYNEGSSKNYKIYVSYGTYEVEVASVVSSGGSSTASSTISVNDNFFKNFSNTNSNSTISGQFRMYGYDDIYGLSDTYAIATNGTGGTLSFTVSFQEAPYFATGANLIATITSIYGRSTIPNPKDTMTLEFPVANDYNGNTVSYFVYEEIYDSNSNLIKSFSYEPTITIASGKVTASFEISDNTYENSQYLIKVEPFTNYGYGQALMYEYDYKGRVTSPSFEVVSSSVDSSNNLTINCKFNDKGGNNKSIENFRNGFAYTVYINGTANSSTIADTFSITYSNYTQSIPLIIRLDGYAANNRQQQVTSSLSYIHYLAEPTVAYRKNYLGINTSTPAGGDVIIDIRAYDVYKKVKLVGPTKTITINLEDGTIDGAIISGGEWTS